MTIKKMRMNQKNVDGEYDIFHPETSDDQVLMGDGSQTLDQKINEIEQEAETHSTNETVHITAEERTAWNAKETPEGAQEKADEAKAYTDTAPEKMLQAMGRFGRYRSDKNANGTFLTVEEKRIDGTLFMRSVFSEPNAAGNPLVRTVTTYATDGITVVGTPVIFDITYDDDEDYVTEVPR